jgi:hypothetical protein
MTIESSYQLTFLPMLVVTAGADKVGFTIDCPLQDKWKVGDLLHHLPLFRAYAGSFSFGPCAYWASTAQLLKREKQLHYQSTLHVA